MAELPGGTSSADNVISDLLVSEIVHDILSNVASFLPRENLADMFCVCKAWAKLSDSEILWKLLIERQYGPQCLIPCHSWHQLCKTIVNTKFSIFDFGLCHYDASNPDHGPFWRKQQSDASRFGHVAKLNQVCWLEFGGVVPADRVKLDPGCYDVIWRINIPSREAANFDCDWTATVKAAGDQIVSETQIKTVKRDPIWTNVIGKDWFLFNVGSIELQSGTETISVRSIGGNSYWFSALEIDCLILRPVLKKSMNERKGDIELHDTIMRPPKEGDAPQTSADGEEEEDDEQPWGDIGHYNYVVEEEDDMDDEEEQEENETGEQLSDDDNSDQEEEEDPPAGNNEDSTEHKCLLM